MLTFPNNLDLDPGGGDPLRELAERVGQYLATLDSSELKDAVTRFKKLTEKEYREHKRGLELVADEWEKLKEQLLRRKWQTPPSNN